MYQFYPQLVLRSPAYPREAYRETDLQNLLKDPFFQAALNLASKPLYQALDKKGFAEAALSSGALLTLKKYLNRMCFRPTPFGLFSGFSVVNWGAARREPLQWNREGLQVHAAMGFEAVLTLANKLLAEELAPYHTYRRNASLYRVLEEHRYVRYDTKRGKREFFIGSFRRQALMASLLRFCETARSKEAMVAFVKERAAVTAEEGLAFVEQLAGQQLLVSTLEANITGEDYLTRLYRLCQSLGIDTPRTRKVGALLQELRAVSGVTGAADLGARLSHLEAVLHPEQHTTSPFYTNLYQGKVLGGLDSAYQQAILDGLDCLHKLVPAKEPKGLRDFRNAFVQKFENKTVPLLYALDPETGVGYEELAGSVPLPELLQGVVFPTGEPQGPSIPWTAAQALLLQKWSTSSGFPAVLQLTADEVDALAREESLEMPPSISVLFRVVGGQVYLEQAGGASATSLIGRFTPLHPDVDRMARSIAAREAAASPQVIFAEIAHLCDGHTANVERREAFREYEIPVFVQSTLPLERQVLLADLWVRVEAGQVILLSKSLGKRVVPRLGTAFNYTRNDLSVFRFLCDLQYQGIRSGFTLSLSSFFPGMGHYPRVEYKSAILHLASWHLQKEQLDDLQGTVVKQRPERLRGLARQLGWPRHIALTAQDHQLVFDLEDDADCAFFVECTRRAATAVVQEFPFAAEQEPVVTDGRNRSYISQFAAALYHQQEVYPAYKPNEQRSGTKATTERMRLPEREWLYLKVYCHPSRSNQLLTEMLVPVIGKLMRKEVKQWFFVRYRDPDYHLRVRLAISPGSAGAVAMRIFHKLSRSLGKGIVGKLEVAVYEREWERYGPGRMEAVEEVFCASTALVLASLKETGVDEADYSYYRVAFSGIDTLLEAFGYTLQAKAQLLQQLYDSLQDEFGGGKPLRRQLSVKFREISTATDVLPRITVTGNPAVRRGKRLHAAYWSSLQSLARQAIPAAERRHLVADLMHMHLNRVFVDQPRRQELVVYFCLWRHYQSAWARAGS